MRRREGERRDEEKRRTGKRRAKRRSEAQRGAGQERLECLPHKSVQSVLPHKSKHHHETQAEILTGLCSLACTRSHNNQFCPRVNWPYQKPYDGRLLLEAEVCTAKYRSHHLTMH